VGDQVTLDQVLLVGGAGDARIGKPRVSGAAVTATIVAQDRGKKVLIFKKRRRKGYTKKQGHRQYYTELKITGISA
jgi:large subunit ribosomal protein L21